MELLNGFFNLFYLLGEISFVLPLMYLDTVDFETPAYAATSLMVTFVCFFSFIQKTPKIDLLICFETDFK